MSTTPEPGTASIPQSQIVLPLLASLSDHGPLAAKQAADAVAERLNIGSDVRNDTVEYNGRKFNRWDRSVRWAEQRARLNRLTTRDDRGRWTLTSTAQTALLPATPGVVVTVYESNEGIALWGSVESVEGLIEPRSLNAIVTSPPYPLEGKSKAYGGLTGRDYEDWLVQRLAKWKSLLTNDGSCFLNLGDVWVSGQPTISLYQERVLLRIVEDLGYHLAEKLYWYNANKLPAPAAFVTVQRIRVTPAIEQIYWLSPSTHPKADNRRVLRQYSASMNRTLKTGTNQGVRPSGYTMNENAFRTDNGGSIPHNLIVATNPSDPNYVDYCKRNNLPQHPARFPDAIPRFAIQLATEPGDIVWDPFAGSLTTALAAKSLDRKYVVNDCHRAYLEGALSRISPEAAGALF